MLKNNIARKIENTKFQSNISLFAREASITRDVIARILSGQIKNPRVATLEKIAKALKCTAAELLGEQAMPSSYSELLTDQDDFHKDLFHNCLNYVSNYIKHAKPRKVTTKKVLLALDAIYNFSYRQGLSEPNQEVAKGLCRISFR